MPIFQDHELERKCKQGDNMRNFILQQIEEHESTFDNENIRDLVDLYWKTVKHGHDINKKYLTSRYITSLQN